MVQLSKNIVAACIGKLFLLIVFIISFPAIQIVGQTKASGEIGVFAGGSYYLGDLNKVPFVESNLALGVLYRHTIDSRFSATGNLNYGHLSGDASEIKYDFPTDYQFRNTFYELNGQMEYNFIPYTPTSKKYRFTPVVYTGIGLMYYPNGTKKFIFNIPFGIGVKYNLYKNYMLGIQAGMRKSFRDDLDYPYYPPPQDNPMQNNYAGSKDWYSVFGVYLSYKIKYRQKCPAFD